MAPADPRPRASGCSLLRVAHRSPAAAPSRSPSLPRRRRTSRGSRAGSTRSGIKVRDYVSGDPGCSDGDLAKTAIRFTAQGLDQATPETLYLYVFNNHDAFERNRAKIGPCAAGFVTDPASFEEIEQSPYVVASQGPWAPQFEAVLRATLEQAAGTGG